MRALLIVMLSLVVAQPVLAQRDFTANPDAERTDIWYDRTDPGWALAIAPSGTVTSALLADFDASGEPRWWYGGALSGASGEVSLALYRARWDVSHSRMAGTTSAGAFQFRRSDEDHATLNLTLEGRTRHHQLTRYVVNRGYSVGDRSGFWFDALEGGHGQLLIQQGGWLGSMSLGYDRNGEPTWVFAQGPVGTGSLQSQRIWRVCDPQCRNVTGPGGTVQLLFPGQDDAVASIVMTDAVGTFWSRSNKVLTRYTQAPNARAHPGALANFGSEAALAQYFVKTTELNPYYGFENCVDFSPTLPASPIASTTNVQETGVDEHDRMKQHAGRLYSIAQQGSGESSPQAGLSVYAMSGANGSLQLLQRLPVITEPGAHLVGLHLRPRADSAVLIVLASTQPFYPGFDDYCGYSPLGGKTWAIVYDVQGNGLPVERRRLEIDGALATSRMLGNTVYLATANVVRTDSDGQPVFPQWRVDQGVARPLLERSNVWLPNFAPDAWERTLTTLTKFDLDRPEAPKFASVFARVDASYVSATSWYLATTQYRVHSFVAPVLIPQGRTIDIHKLRLSDLDYRGSGTVLGSVFDTQERSFRFSEHEGYLRVLTDRSASTPANSLFLLSVLAEDANTKQLRVVATLPNAQRPAPIGPAHERPYGVRFVGDVLYAVSFYKVDPLYAIDLSDPLDPKLDGELEITGYSSYLHALEGGFVLGFGLDATPAMSGDGPGFAWFQGLKFSLFDQRDRAHPREHWRALVGKRGSTAPLLADHRAFASADVGDGWLRVAVPVRVNDGAAMAEPWMYYPWQLTGVVGFDVQTATGNIRSFATRPALQAASGEPSNPWLSETMRTVLYGDSLYFLIGDRWYGTRFDDAGPMHGPF